MKTMVPMEVLMQLWCYFNGLPTI